MKKLHLLAIAATFALGQTASAQVLVTPGSHGGPHCLSPAFSTATCTIGDEYLGSHLRFSNTATFDDGDVDAWGGINSFNTVDLLTPVVASLWSTDGVNKYVTNALRVEVGWAAAGSLTLNVYDVMGTLLGTRVNGLDGDGVNGRTNIMLNIEGIHSFSVSGNDEWGMDEIEFATPTAAGVSVVPEPGSFLLVAAGLAGVVVAGRNRKRIAK
jgi:hypothetical protein